MLPGILDKKQVGQWLFIKSDVSWKIFNLNPNLDLPYFIYLHDSYVIPNGKVVTNLILMLISKNSSYGKILKMLFS